jgi:hypothetical protein
MNITRQQNREFGMVAILITTFIAFYFKKFVYIKFAFVLTAITLLFPVFLYPLAICWFTIGKFLGIVSSAILLSLVFIFFVIPVGLIRKIGGYDDLKLKQFKKSDKSVMVDRSHLYEDKDLVHSF